MPMLAIGSSNGRALWQACKAELWTGNHSYPGIPEFKKIKNVESSVA